ncbi:MAG TPA: DUF1059 domain-containing protein [Candidatus Nanoarchaeia archaeon]|nr:DUF1059 domain-containing protein [Candidatus Nanoarchaeia archaeon]
MEKSAKAKRFMVDCRSHPSVNNCSLKIEGTKEEVLKAAVRHAVEDHQHKDTPQLRKMLEIELKAAD